MAWFDEQIPPDLTYDDGGVAKPLRDHQFVRESPDLPSFVKKAFDTHREVGSRIPLKIEKDRNPDGTFAPRKSSIAAWREQHLPKLYENGILERPPQSPEEYGVVKPAELPEGVEWNDERATKLTALAHKHGVPKAFVNELLSMYTEIVAEDTQAYQGGYDEAIAALKSEFGDQFDTRMDQAKKLAAIVFKDNPEFLSASGIGNYPPFLSIMMRLAPFAEQDSSLVEQVREGATPNVNDRDALRAEYYRIQTDKTHPMYEGFWKNDPAVHKKIDEMYKKIVGPGSFEIGTQLTQSRI